MQGYGSKDRKGTSFDDWDLSDTGPANSSGVVFSFFALPCYFKFMVFQQYEKHHQSSDFI